MEIITLTYDENWWTCDKALTKEQIEKVRELIELLKEGQ